MNNVNIVIATMSCTLASVAVLYFAVCFKKMYTMVKESHKSLVNIEAYLEDMTDDSSSDDKNSPNMFRSVDGKYEAKTLPELIEKMTKDLQDSSDPSKLDNFLKDLRDDDDEDVDPWKKKKQ
jgi:hypothetical protein